MGWLVTIDTNWIQKHVVQVVIYDNLTSKILFKHYIGVCNIFFIIVLSDNAIHWWSDSSQRRLISHSFVMTNDKENKHKEGANNFCIHHNQYWHYSQFSMPNKHVNHMKNKDYPVICESRICLVNSTLSCSTMD